MPVSLTCPQCGKTYHRPPALVPKPPYYCSLKCRKASLIPSHTKTCEACGKPFYVREAHRLATARWCSVKCRSDYGTTLRVCEACGSEFTVDSARVKYGRFCSWRCRKAAWAAQSTMRECEQCHKSFHVGPRTVNRADKHGQKRSGVYCSRACSIEARRDEGARTRVAFTCWQCGKECAVKPSQIRRNRGHFCSRSCASTYYVTRLEHTSKQETEFLDALQAQGVNMMRQKRIGPYIVDAYIPDLCLIIEFDGVYWHSQKQDYDAERDTFLRSHGYAVIHVTDVLWRTNRNAAIETVLRHVKACRANGVTAPPLWAN